MHHGFDQVAPRRKISRSRTQAQLATYDLVEAFCVQRRRNLVDRIGVERRNYGLRQVARW